MSERRRFRRVVIHQRCWCEGGNVTLYAQMGNVSEGGAFVCTHAPLQMGAKAKVRFLLKEGEQIETEATVVWRCDDSMPGLTAGMGLRFETLADQLREALRSWVATAKEVDEEGT